MHHHPFHRRSHANLLDGLFVAAVAMASLLCFVAVLLGLS
jgi:hypothetical protein